MSELNVFQNTSDLELFSLIVGVVSLVVVVILAVALYLLSRSIHKLKKEVTAMKKKENYSFYNPTIQPDEELAKRGFSMYNGKVEDRQSRTSIPETDLQFGTY